MKDLSNEAPASERDELPPYEPPRITILEDEEVLKAFQMTAMEISAAGCWWMTS
jgi:hypothetical protein